MKRFWDKVQKTETCWLWTAWRNNKGYGALMMRHPGGGFMNKLAHRVAWELVNGEIPSGLCVLHACDNPQCVNPAHLSLGTKKDNTRDMLAKKRNRCGRLSGEKHYASKITAAQARYARHLYFAERHSAVAIAELLCISKYIVQDIARGKTWRATGTPA